MRHSLNGKHGLAVRGTIFDGLFGSFDEFEKRYPRIVSMLSGLKEFSGQIETQIYATAGVDAEDSKFNSAIKFLLDLGGSITGLFGGGGNPVAPTSKQGQSSPTAITIQQASLLARQKKLLTQSIILQIPVQLMMVWVVTLQNQRVQGENDEKINRRSADDCMLMQCLCRG